MPQCQALLALLALLSCLRLRGGEAGVPDFSDHPLAHRS